MKTKFFALFLIVGLVATTAQANSSTLAGTTDADANRYPGRRPAAF